VTVYLLGRLTLGPAGALGVGLFAWLITGAAKDGRR